MARNQRADIPSTVEWVKVSDCTIGVKYQRKIDTVFVDKVCKEFDPNLFGVPTLVRTGSGRLVVVDGQHRVLALRQMGWGDQMIQCEIHNEESYEQSALTHVERNDRRRGWTAYDKFNARVEAKQPVQLAVKRICESEGFVVLRAHGSLNGDGNENKYGNAITAVSTMEKIFINHGGPALERVLRAAVDAWGITSDAVRANVLKALDKLFAEYDRMIDEGRLAKSMKRFRPAEYEKRGKAGQEVNRGSVVNNMVMALVADYNNLPGGKKLPPATELVGRGVRGTTGRRLTVQQREQVKELLKQGYAAAQLKERFPNLTTKTLKNIRAEVGPVKRRRKVKAAR